MPVEVTEENKAKCICGGCPSYNDCMKEGRQGLFCGMGKSSCEVEKKGCLCMDCPVYSENSLQGGYFCLTGLARSND